MELNVFVMTRFGVDVKDESWLRNRIKIFEAITFNSLKSQTYKNFTWHFFVGEKPFEWFINSLEGIFENSGLNFYFHYCGQKASEVRNAFNKKDVPNLMLMIDDDDAWHPKFLELAVEQAHYYLEKGLKRVAWTFPRGIEYLPAKIVDVDRSLRNQNERYADPFCREFVKPFLTMSICVLSESGYVTPKVNSIHHKKCENLLEDGFILDEVLTAEYMWCYFRHPQADSSISKKGEKDNVDIAPDDYFCFNKRLFGKYKASFGDIPLSVKRSHKLADKAQLLYKNFKF